MKKKIRMIILAILLMLLLIVGGVYIGMKLPSKDTPPTDSIIEQEGDDWNGNKGEYTGEQLADTIDIPGFDRINFKAGETKQQANIFNPEQNTCYFQISLIMEDGTLLWQSKMIAPGKGLYEIELNQALSVGVYENATLKYECFRMDEALTQLNGAEIKLNINVLK